MYTWGYIKDAALAKLDITETEATAQNLLGRFPFYANEVITQVCSAVKPKCDFACFDISDADVGIAQKMPSDFISFGDDVNFAFDDRNSSTIELHDDDFSYIGYNTVVFTHTGKFYISYNARWFTFSKSLDNDEVLEIPTDILECIPSYIASQCYKIDDEYKAQVFRNEYEILLSRIDATNYKNTKTIKIDGGW